MRPAFSSTKIVPGCICSGIHSLSTSSSATISPPDGQSLLRTQFRLAYGTRFLRSTASGTLAPADNCLHLADGVTQAYGQHRLAGIFQYVHNLLGRGFEIQRMAVAQQVIIGGPAYSFSQTLTELFLQKADHFAHPLQGKPFAPQFADNRDFG